MLCEKEVIEAFEDVINFEYEFFYGDPINDDPEYDSKKFFSLVDVFGLRQTEGQVFLPFSNERLSHRFVDRLFKILFDTPESANKAAELIGSYLLPMCGISVSDEPTEARLGISNYNFCGEAESHFFNLHNQSTIFPSGIHSRISVYHDDNNDPLIFRKEKVESSALLLQDFSISGIPVPAGTIVDISGSKVEKTGEVLVSDAKTGTRYESYLIDSGFVIAPGRLSPWVHSESMDKSFFAVERQFGEFNIDIDRLDICSRLRRSDFRAAAERVIELAQST